MPLAALDPFIQQYYEVHEWRHASAILTADFQAELSDIQEVLINFRLRRSQILAPGGSKSDIAGSIDGELIRRGWQEKKFHTQIRVDDHEMDTPTHKVDCFKNRVALEIEWNNKDPFFDRDLNNFPCFLIFVLSVSALSLPDAVNCNQYSTHWAKALRMEIAQRT